MSIDNLIDCAISCRKININNLCLNPSVESIESTKNLIMYLIDMRIAIVSLTCTSFGQFVIELRNDIDLWQKLLLDNKFNLRYDSIWQLKSYKNCNDFFYSFPEQKDHLINALNSLGC